MSEAQTAAVGNSSSAGWEPSVEALLKDWRSRASAASAAHYVLATRLRRRNLALGIPVVVFSTVVGTSVFATLAKDRIDIRLSVAVGLTSVAAAVLAALQTFLRFPERAEKHVTAADWYAALRRDLDQTLALPPAARGAPKECLDRIRKEMSKVGQSSPEIPAELWAQLSKEHCVAEETTTIEGQPAG